MGLKHPITWGIQDILGLPRKQKNLNSLITGLAEFGLTGQFSKTRISHDEIDAICAAVGGLFFLADEYDTVGDPYEGLIILPKIKYTQRHSETAEYKSPIWDLILCFFYQDIPFSNRKYVNFVISLFLLLIYLFFLSQISAPLTLSYQLIPELYHAG